MTKRLKRNALKCLKCNTVIESKHTHDFVRCKCGECFVDGGLAYVRAGGDFDHMEMLTEYEDEA